MPSMPPSRASKRDHVGGDTLQQGQGVLTAVRVAHDAERLLLLQHPPQTFAYDVVIVHQKNADFFLSHHNHLGSKVNSAWDPLAYPSPPSAEPGASEQGMRRVIWVPISGVD